MVACGGTAWIDFSAKHMVHVEVVVLQNALVRFGAIDGIEASVGLIAGKLAQFGCELSGWSRPR